MVIYCIKVAGILLNWKIILILSFSSLENQLESTGQLLSPSLIIISNLGFQIYPRLNPTQHVDVVASIRRVSYRMKSELYIPLPTITDKYIKTDCFNNQNVLLSIITKLLLSSKYNCSLHLLVVPLQNLNRLKYSNM